MANTSIPRAITLLAGLVVMCEAGDFLRAGPRGGAGQVNAEYVRQSLVAELAAAPGGKGGAHLSRVQAALRPTFTALPKNEHGGLEHTVVRYALHRYFIQRHGWYVKGLEPGGRAWNDTSQVELVKDRVPSYIQGVIEERLGGRGVGLRELAVLVATLEDLVESEAVERLGMAYSAMDVLTSSPLYSNEADFVLYAYMLLYINPPIFNSTEQVAHALDNADAVYPGWSATQMWARDVRKGVVHIERGRLNPFVDGATNFPGMVRIVEEIGERYGRYQDLECRTLKEELLELEDRGTGRVRLSTFYRSTLGGKWQFSENVEYLRQLGALDESDPKRPSVVIPNYVNARSNCLASSSYYSVCCIDECEGLMSHLEHAVVASAAEPGQIAEVVAALPSDTVEAPRNLSAPLLRRLDQIAAYHGGRVPLHGRLFAQWMHHAYPRECTYPQVAGTTDPHTPMEWMAKGRTMDATKEEMRQHAADTQEDSDLTMEAKLEAVPWNEVEELLSAGSGEPRARGRGRAAAIFRILAFVAVVASMAIGLLWTSAQTLSEVALHDGSAMRRQPSACPAGAGARTPSTWCEAAAGCPGRAASVGGSRLCTGV